MAGELDAAVRERRGRGAGGSGSLRFSCLLTNFHNTNFIIWKLPCKSQSSATLGYFCAIAVPVGKRMSLVELSCILIY